MTANTASLTAGRSYIRWVEVNLDGVIARVDLKIWVLKGKAS